MAIIRKGPGEYAKGKSKGLTERKPEDYDLAFDKTRIYIIDENEWFDPHTSTKYDGPNGISRHAYVGPSFIVQSEYGSLRTDEYHVNDPGMWAWVRRLIKEGILTAETLVRDLPCDERAVEIKEAA